MNRKVSESGLGRHHPGSRFVGFLGAVLGLAVIAGLAPVCLAAMARWRFGSARPWAGIRPDALTDPAALIETVSGRVTDQMLVDLAVRLVVVVGWICVLLLMSSVAIEVVQQLRRVESSPVRIRGLGWSQKVARSIAGGLLLVTPMHGFAGASTMAGHSVVATPSAAGVHQVVTGETLWEIADQVLGNPLRWTEIWSINQDRTMKDGRVFDDPHLILPGWELQLPPETTAAPSATRAFGALDPIAAALDGPFSREFAASVEEVEVVDGLGAEQSLRDDATAVVAATGPAGDVVETVRQDVTEEASGGVLLHLGSATMLATGILAGLAARRRHRLRESTSEMRPLPIARLMADRHLSAQLSPEDVTEELDEDTTVADLQVAEDAERILRLDLLLRIVASPLVAHDQAIAAAMIDERGQIELLLTGEVELERPLTGRGRNWVMPTQVGVDRLIEMARDQDHPCPALIHLGNALDGREIYVDLEVIGVLSLTGHRSDGLSDRRFADVVRAIQMTLCNSVFVHKLQIYWVDPDAASTRAPVSVFGASQVQMCPSFEDLRERLTQSDSTLLKVVVISDALNLIDAPEEIWSDSVVVVGRGQVPATGARLRPEGGWWVLEGPVFEEVEIQIRPLGVSVEEATDLGRVIEEESQQPVLVYSAGDLGSSLSETDDQEAPATSWSTEARGGALPEEHLINESSRSLPEWKLMVRVMGAVDVVDTNGEAVRFERSKSLELLAWCVTHRGRSTRTAARTALWEMNVRDATFANVVSEARRATSQLVPLGRGRDWVVRTLTEELAVDPEMTSDAEVLRAALDLVDLYGVHAVIPQVEAALGLIRGMPCEGSTYLWPEAEGISSELIMVATSLSALLAGHYLAHGDGPGVFRATAAGLLALPGHEELIALRMRAHAAAGDLSGVKHEWTAYLRVIARDPWSGGEPAPKLRELSGELLGMQV